MRFFTGILIYSVIPFSKLSKPDANLIDFTTESASVVFSFCQQSTLGFTDWIFCLNSEFERESRESDLRVSTSNTFLEVGLLSYGFVRKFFRAGFRTGDFLLLVTGKVLYMF